MTNVQNPIRAEKRLAAACGLFCPACTLFIGTAEDPARLAKLAARRNMPVENLQCEGCRAERRGFYCRQCKMIACTTEKGLDFCYECESYPCEELKEFQAQMPHRIELWDSLARIQEKGFEVWFEEKLNHYACPACGILNSAYDLACRRCGHEPGSEYVKRNRAEIERYIKDQQ